MTNETIREKEARNEGWQKARSELTCNCGDSGSITSPLRCELCFDEDVKKQERTIVNIINDIVKEIKAQNPYPQDVFIGTTEEGLRGKAAHIAWDNACSEIEKRILEEFYDA